jgi:hypothetical protein
MCLAIKAASSNHSVGAYTHVPFYIYTNVTTRIESKTEHPIQQQLLAFNGKTIDDQTTASDG